MKINVRYVVAHSFILCPLAFVFTLIWLAIGFWNAILLVLVAVVAATSITVGQHMAAQSK